eukprot:scaffold37294_cov55-Phaeocystis_antarctica.AAC.5
MQHVATRRLRFRGAHAQSPCGQHEVLEGHHRRLEGRVLLHEEVAVRRSQRLNSVPPPGVTRRRADRRVVAVCAQIRPEGQLRQPDFAPVPVEGRRVGPQEGHAEDPDRSVERSGHVHLHEERQARLHQPARLEGELEHAPTHRLLFLNVLQLGHVQLRRQLECVPAQLHVKRRQGVDVTAVRIHVANGQQQLVERGGRDRYQRRPRVNDRRAVRRTVAAQRGPPAHRHPVEADGPVQVADDRELHVRESGDATAHLQPARVAIALAVAHADRVRPQR